MRACQESFYQITDRWLVKATIAMYQAGVQNELCIDPPSLSPDFGVNYFASTYIGRPEREFLIVGCPGKDRRLFMNIVHRPLLTGALLRRG